MACVIYYCNDCNWGGTDGAKKVSSCPECGGDVTREFDEWMDHGDEE